MQEYCGHCGTKLEQQEEFVWWCSNCSAHRFANPKPATELVLYRNGKILLSKRAVEPGKGKFDMPGGFVEEHEAAEEALAREIEEELGLTQKDYEEPQYLRSYNTEYPYGGVVHRVLVLVYAARMHEAVTPKALDDVAATMWMQQSEINDVDWSHAESKKNAEIAFSQRVVDSAEER